MTNACKPRFSKIAIGALSFLMVISLSILSISKAIAASEIDGQQAHSKSPMQLLAQQTAPSENLTTSTDPATPTPSMDSESTQDGVDSENDRSDLDPKIRDAISNAVDQKIGSVLKKLDLLFAFQELQTLSASLEAREIVTDAARDEILKHLARLKDLEGYESVPGFQSILRRIVDSFTSSYQVAAVDEIDDLYRAELSRMPDTPSWMTNHFGRVLVTSTDLRDRSSKRWERLQHYSDISKQNRNPEISLLWEILTQFMQASEQRSPDVDTRIGMLEHFSEEDRTSFFEALDQESNTSPGEPPDLRRLAQVATKLLDTYQAEFAQYGYQPNG